MAKSSGSGALLVLLTLITIPTSAVAIAAVKKWNARAVAVETIFQGNQNTGLPFKDPGRFMVDSKGNTVILDKKLDSVFKLDRKGKLLWKIAGTPSTPKRFQGLQYLYIDSKDQVWILDFLSDTLCSFAPNGKFLRSFKVARYPRSFVVASTGEIITNPGTGSHLLDVYSPTGKYLRSFGRRFPYPNDTADFEFNSGNMAAGSKGEIYFSFNYPPVIRAYSSGGQVLWEARIPFDWPIARPQVSTVQLPGGLTAAIQYQVASLDLSIGDTGQLLCLTAGTPEKIAFQRGTQRIDVFSRDGRHLGAVTLPVSASRMAFHPSGLFLLENHEVKTLTRFAFQPTG